MNLILPAPKFNNRSSSDRNRASLNCTEQVSPPKYGNRSAWLPRTLHDFNDGGAYPELPVAQYPLEMGRRKDANITNSQVVTLQVDRTGRVGFEALAQHGHSSDRIVYSRHQDLVPMDVKHDDSSLSRPSPKQVAEITEKTKQALGMIVDGKVQNQKVTHIVSTEQKAQYIKYTPQILGSGGEVGSTRVVRMVQVAEDPFEPPRFKHKKLPKGPSSPPPPVMHSPPRKITVEEQRAWFVPPCISNWKNSKGYTIPLDKRLAADGRGLQEVTINDNFAKFAEALYIADRHAREEVERRAQLQKKIAQKDKEAKEQHLRELAQQAREEKAGFNNSTHQEDDESFDRSRQNMGDNDGDDRDFQDRQNLRREREQDIQRKIRMSHMGTAAKSKYVARALDRDVSEKVALGLAAPSVSQETMYDQRLFNQTAGMSSGFAQDDAYNLYDKPLFNATAGASIYRPKNLEGELYGGGTGVDIDSIMSKNHFVPDKGFAGTETAEPRDGPVRFEKAPEDPFGLDEFLNEAKLGSISRPGLGDREGISNKRLRSE